MSFGVSPESLRSSEPYLKAVNAFMTCVGESHVSASGEGCYNMQTWGRDFSKEVEAMLSCPDLYEYGWDKTIFNVLCKFLDKGPDVPYRLMPFLHRVPGRIPNPNQHETKVPMGKRLINADQYLGENPAMADTFLILLAAGKFITSKNIDFRDKTRFWAKERDCMRGFYRFLVENGNGLMSPNGLITEAPMASRMDGVLKSGNVLLTNVNWYRTLGTLADSAHEMMDFAWEKELCERSERVKQTINTKFWNEEGGYYYDWIDKKGVAHDNLEAMGNCVAIVAGLANLRQSNLICDAIRHRGMVVPEYGLVATVDKKYIEKELDRTLIVINFQEWYNSTEGGVFWPEMGAMYAAALKKTGRDNEAIEILTGIEKILAKHGTLSEIHDRNGDPLNHLCRFGFLYRSPLDFGMALANYFGVKQIWHELSPDGTGV